MITTVADSLGMSRGAVLVRFLIFGPRGATEGDLGLGSVLQSAGALTVAMGFFAAAWTAPAARSGPIDPAPAAGGQPELVATYGGPYGPRRSVSSSVRLASLSTVPG
jgi:hypothetical protein